VTKFKPTEKRRVGEKKKVTVKSDYADPFSNLTCTGVLGDRWDWHMESGQKVGQNPYPGHDNKPDDPHHALTIAPNDREFYCHECEGGGGVSKLLAMRAGIMKCDDSRSSPDGSD